jgi:hypothetical protein
MTAAVMRHEREAADDHRGNQQSGPASDAGEDATAGPT